MTSRCGNGALQLLQSTRTKRLVQLVQIERRDGTVFRFTDHDRPLYCDGSWFVPRTMGTLSSDKRESGAKSTTQQALGTITADEITDEDLGAGLFDGATVRTWYTDFRMPWLWFRRTRRTLRKVERSGSTWKADLDGVAADLQMAQGSRFGGTFSEHCPHRLGAAYGDPAGKGCTVNMTVGAGHAYIGNRVATVSTSGLVLTFDSATWPGTFDDEWFRDGEIEWIWAASVATGTSTSATTTTTLTDTTKSWATDEHVGRLVMMLTGAGGPVIDGTSYAEITANTATTLTFAGGVGAAHGSGTPYAISPYCRNRGASSTIVRYAHTSRTVELLAGPPFLVLPGDGGIHRVGCDGLRTTCKAKFSNLADFGGDPFAPNPSEIIEPVQ